MAVAKVSFYQKVPDPEDKFKNAMGVMEKLCGAEQYISQVEKILSTNRGTDSTEWADLSVEEVGRLVGLAISHFAEQFPVNS